jgi:hypothetical protein
LIGLFCCLGIIRLVTGPLGTGKSYYAVRKAVEQLLFGKMIITNFSLREDWVQRAVTHGKIRKRSKRLREKVDRFERRYLRVHSLEELMRVRVRPEEPFARKLPNGEWQVKEGACVVFLDEAHRWMNARGWSQKGREEILEWFALARKRGFTVYLLSQRRENLDVQVRELFEDHIELINMKRSVRVLGIPVVPFNLFLAIWRNHGYPKEIQKRELYRLKWVKDLYDTMDTSSFGETGVVPGGVIQLPLDRPPDGRTGEGATAGVGAPRQPARPLAGDRDLQEAVASGDPVDGMDPQDVVAAQQ